MQRVEPLRLERLALMASCDRLIQLCQKLASMPKPSEAEMDRRLLQRDLAITFIRDLVMRYIPSPLVNEWIHMFLTTLDKDLYFVIEHRITEEWVRLLTRDLIKSIVPPAVTRFYCNHSWYFLLPEIYTALKTMSNLQDLKLGWQREVTFDDFDLEQEYLQEFEEDCIITGLQHMKRLLSFSFGTICTDKVVKALSYYQPQLYSLYLPYCRDVTDEAVPAFQRFHNLQKLFLVGTSLSNSGVLTLLRELPNGGALRTYSRNNVTDEELVVLVRQCPNLTCVELVADFCQSLAPLKKLNNLRRLHISHTEFDYLRELLILRGEQLLELELYAVYNVDVPFIGNTCLVLTNLSIVFCYNLEVMPEEEEYMLAASSPTPPGFANVTYVELVVDDYLHLVVYVMSHCYNLKYAEVSVCGDDDDCLIESILKRNPLSNLEQLRWVSSSTYELSFEGAKHILEQCHQMCELMGPESWSSHPDYEEFLEEMKARFPGCLVS